MKNEKKYEYCGYVIEKRYGWCVLNWDYEEEVVVYYAKNKNDAEKWALNHS